MTRDDLSALPFARLFALMVWGEARGEPIEGQVAVACVARNRWKRPDWWGTTPGKVLLAPKQFSCFNPDDLNFGLLDNPAAHSSQQVWDQCLWVAKGVWRDYIMDNTLGSDHYVSSWFYKQLQERALVEPVKHWALEHEPTGRVGRHVFFALGP